MEDVIKEIKNLDKKKTVIYSIYALLAVLAFLAGNYLGSIYLPEVKSRVIQLISNQEAVRSTDQGGSVGIKNNSTLEVDGETIAIPGEGASTQERADFGNILSQNAVSTKSVIVGSECKLDPAIFKLTSGEAVTFVNEDEKIHDISIFNTIETIEVSEEVEITLNMDPGFYGVVCDNTFTSGFLVLE